MKVAFESVSINSDSELNWGDILRVKWTNKYSGDEMERTLMLTYGWVTGEYSNDDADVFLVDLESGFVIKVPDDEELDMTVGYFREYLAEAHEYELEEVVSSNHAQILIRR